MGIQQSSIPGVVLADRRGRQFSLLVLLLVMLVACVTAAYWGERRRRLDAEVGAIRKEEERIRLGKFVSQKAAPTELSITDPKLVHIKALPPGAGARDEPGWDWRIYLPKGEWWLYVSQGEAWDAASGKYRDHVSGSQIKIPGELEVYGCLSFDHEGGRWIQNWGGEANQAAGLSDVGLAVLKGRGETIRTVTGEISQATSEIRPVPGGRIQLFRWHKVLDAEAADEASRLLPGRDRPLQEYGFSIYLVEESPLPVGPRTKGQTRTAEP